MAKETEKSNVPATTGTTAMTRPDFIKTGDHRGTEHLTKDDLKIPRLALAQGLTPQVAEQKEGFTTGVMFNSMTEEIYGKGPLSFFVVRSDRPRHVQFRPREEGGGIIDMNVPANDPRTRFRLDPEHPDKSLKPLATKFYDYIICMLPLGEDPFKNVISLSFKSSGLKVAREFNTLIKYRNAPLFAGIYTIKSVVEKNAQGIFNNFKIDNAGWQPTEDAMKMAEDMFNALKDREITIDRTDADLDPEDAGDFPPGREPGMEG